MSFHIGDRVEILGVEDGLADTFSEGTIINLAPDHITVRQEHAFNMQDEPLVVDFPFHHIRPFPATIRARLNPGDDIDAWVNNTWVRGRYRRREPEHPQELIHRVYFPHRPEGQRFQSFEREDVRFHQTFAYADPLQNIGRWTYRRVRMAYRPHDRVEILETEDGLENSLYAATVNQVLPHQLIVTNETLEDDDGQPLTQAVFLQNVRPYPARIRIPVRFSPGDDVNVFYNDGWWWGIYREYQGNRDDGLRHQVHFAYMTAGQTESNYRRADVRIHQEFEFHDNFHFTGTWTYTRRLCCSLLCMKAFDLTL